ncbi:MAG TPA: polysaccharide deacetylase family protein, partial [Candidatus Polarisedimenticolia bacterium]|nr:polysaccharide deacetylase family protein [Candidatus Polarisedimenticolia bacterium]
GPMIVRRALKSGLSAALRFTGTHRIAGRLAAGAPPAVLVVGYHRVLPDLRAGAGSIRSLVVTTAALEKQLDWIGARHRFVALDEAGELARGARSRGRPAAAVTFDDGYADVHEHALPLLLRKGIPAGVFVVTGLAGTSFQLPHDRLFGIMSRAGAAPPAAGLRGELPAAVERAWRAGGPLAGARQALTTLPPRALDRACAALEQALGALPLPPGAARPLTWDQVRALRAAGLTIGSHTEGHPFLTTVPDGDLAREVAGSRARLEAELGTPVRHFAYPDGRWEPRTVDAVEAAGYGFAYGTCRHADERRPHLTIPRLLLWEDACLGAAGGFSGSLLACQAAGVFGPLARCGTAHGPAPAGQPAARSAAA